MEYELEQELAELAAVEEVDIEELVLCYNEQFGDDVEKSND